MPAGRHGVPWGHDRAETINRIGSYARRTPVNRRLKGECLETSPWHPPVTWGEWW